MGVDYGRSPGGFADAWRGAVNANLSRVSWGAIFAGAICALGFQAVFTLLTLGLGLGLVSDGDASGAGLGSGLFFALTAIASLFAGGWIAGRLSGIPLMPSAILHGVVVWSAATIVAIWLGVSATGAVIGTATQAVSTVGGAAASVAGTAAQGVGSAVQALIPDIESLQAEDMASVVPDSIERDVQQLLEERDLTPEQIGQEVRQITNEVLEPSELRRAREMLIGAGRRMLRDPGQTDVIFTDTLDRLTQQGGPLGEGQFDELQGILEQRYGIDAEQATQYVERWRNEFTEARDEALEAYRQTYSAVAEEVNQAVAAAEEAAQSAAESAASAAWWSGFGLLLGLAAAAAGAAVGRPSDVATAEPGLGDR